VTLEARLALSFSDYALEQLRTRFLYAVTTSHAVATSARVAVQMAFGTEIKAILMKLTTPSPSVLAEVITVRRRFLDVDNDMRGNSFLYEPALTSLTPLNVPDPYVNLLRRHLGSDYPRYRICGTAALLCLAATQSS
jgi:hypothetical protein